MRGNAIHYEATGDYDVIDFCQHYKLSFNRGNVVKLSTSQGQERKMMSYKTYTKLRTI